MEKEKTNLQVLTNGIIKENPTLVLVLGTCPTIAITTMAMNAIGMGFAATFVLVGSTAKGDSRQGSYSVFYRHHCRLCYPAQLASAGVFPQHL